MHRLLIAACALVLVASGCSDGGSSDTVPSADASADPPSTAPIGPGPTSAPTTSATTTTTSAALAELQGLDVEVVVRGLQKPTFAIAPLGDDRLFVLEQNGLVRIVRDSELLADPFLDITDRVGSGNLEQGLLGMAFHPKFAENGRFFLYYTNTDGDSRLVEGTLADPSADQADPASLEEIFAVAQPASNHNAGMLQFGPEGYLYVALGDGGAANDRFGNGQRTDTYLGSMLRIDVDGGDPYAIPPDNPFVEGGGLAEVWAYGLRNPWRFAIDPVAELMIVADVGQSEIEEISVVPLDGGHNFGWPILEGSTCFASPGCDDDGLVLPAVEYSHAEGCSVTGGFPYRGDAIPEMHGHYFYSDWCGGFIRSFLPNADGSASEERDWTEDIDVVGQVTSFGMDGAGEIYMLTSEGFLFRLIPVR